MSPKNIDISVYNRLLEKAKQKNRPFEEVLQYYAMERFLHRLSNSKYSEKFVLKGALMLHVWAPDLTRATKDIDLLGYINNELPLVETIVRDLCNITSEDGISFDSKSITIERIKEDDEYEGLRASFKGKLHTARVNMQLDIGFGDTVSPKPTLVNFPTLLDFPAPKLRGYPRETTIAEKFQAMIELGLLNSRMKDFYDIWFLSQNFEFQGKQLSKSIKETFQKRKTDFGTSTPLIFTDEFAKNGAKQSQWKAFINNRHLDFTPPSLEETLKHIKQFLLPIYEACSKNDSFEKTWDSGDSWKDA